READCMHAAQAAAAPAPPGGTRRPNPIISGRTSLPDRAAVKIFVLAPLLAIAVAVPFAWGWGLSWVDIALGAAFFVVSGLGVTAGYHRLFTHGSYKANRPL